MTSQPGSVEKTLANGIFGTVTTKRVIYKRARGWLAGGFRTDIALTRITSVDLAIHRHVVAGFLLLAIGLLVSVGYSIAPEDWQLAVMLACGFYAVLLFWGWPTVEMSASGMEMACAKAWPWHRQEAHEFVDAVRQVIVQR